MRNKSTVDCVYILQSLIERSLSKGNKLYCTFVDFKSAFDLVIREELWYKLINSGVSTNILRILKSMYASTKLCVRKFSSLSDFFDSNVGVKQGEPLSPFSFLMFVNDVYGSLSADIEENIDYYTIFMLLFADDMILIAKTPQGLQMLLNKLYIYCNEWHIEVNTQKTKTVIFCNRKSNINVNFNYGNNEIEIVDSYVYLGVYLNYNGKLTHAMNNNANQAIRALHGLKNLYKFEIMDVKTKTQLFDSIIMPILLYGSEIWGLQNVNNIDKIQMGFYKSILGLIRILQIVLF